MPEKLKPCPACGVRRDVDILPEQVMCWNCFCRGSVKASISEAVRAWNAMQRPLRWTKETPKEPGWYWIRDYGKRIHIVDMGCDMTEYEPQPYREWAGPIPEPEE